MQPAERWDGSTVSPSTLAYARRFLIGPPEMDLKCKTKGCDGFDPCPKNIQCSPRLDCSPVSDCGDTNGFSVSCQPVNTSPAYTTIDG